MSKKAKILLAVGAVCGLQLVAIALYFRNRAVGDDVKSAAAPTAGERQRQFIEGGVPVHRKRIDDFIAQVAAYPDFDALAAGLNDRVLNGDDIVFAVGVQTQDPVPQMQFAKVLADRRVARLYAMLDQMPDSQAAQSAAKLVDAKLDLHAKGFASRIADWRDGVRQRSDERPVNLEEVGDRAVHAKVLDGLEGARLDFHALSASAFLCAAYCEPLTTLGRIDRWNETIGLHVDEIMTQPLFNRSRLRHDAGRYGRPEKLFLLNLYVLVLERHAGLMVREVQKRVDIPMPWPAMFEERVPFGAWDAHTNFFDFTHLHRGVPADDANVLFEVSLTRSWYGMGSDQAWQDRLLGRVRTLIEELARSRGEEPQSAPAR